MRILQDGSSWQQVYSGRRTPARVSSLFGSIPALSPLRLDDDRRALESELLAQTIGEIALGRKVQLIRLVCEHHELRRSYGRLGQVADLVVVLPSQRLNEAVQPAGANPHRRRIVYLFDQRKERRDPFPFACG